MTIDRGPLQKLHDLVVAVRDELHLLDGSPTNAYSAFINANFEEAAKLNHAAYSAAVTAMENRPEPPTT